MPAFPDDNTLLTDGDCATIDCVLERIALAREACTKCKNAGWPVDSIVAGLDEKQQRLEATKRQFFPNRA